MKLSKKIVSLLLVAVMMMAVCGSAMAAGVTITINRDESYAGEQGDREYTYYQVFRADMPSQNQNTTEGGGVGTDGTPGSVTTTEGVSVSYYLTTADDNAVITKFQSEGNQWFALTASADGSRYAVAWKDGVSTDAATVQAAANWIVDNEAYITSGTMTVADNGASWSATNLEQGYYVIAGSEGKNLVAATTNIEIAEKNSYPTIDKKEKDEDLPEYQDTDPVKVAVGDVIDYQVVVHIPGDANQPIAVIDKMTGGLTYNAATAEFAVKQGETNVAYTELTAADKEYDADADWQIKLSAETVKANQNKDIVITFKATVNSTALTDTARDNTVTLKYNNEHYIQHDTVDYTTYFTGIEKIDATSREALAGVKFVLKEGNSEFKVTAVTENGAVLYYIPDATGSSEVVTGANGKIIIRGLDNDKTYTLTETETLAGYNLLAQPKTLRLVEDKKNNEGTDVYTTETFDPVENKTGSLLPSTGGMGTTLLYVGGGVLVLAAAILLVFKKRVGVEK